jgi:hypothetical protein
MPGKAIGVQMNAGFPGSFSRSGDTVIAARAIKSTDASGPNFGNAMILNDDNTYSDLAVAKAAGVATIDITTFAGIAAREVKSFTTFSPAPTVGNYAPAQVADCIERGSVAITCLVGTPKSGGKVYMRTVLNGAIPAGIVGGFEANADGGNSFELTNCKWSNGYIDANKTTEMTILSRNLP